jgi:hypothetical protein
MSINRAKLVLHGIGRRTLRWIKLASEFERVLAIGIHPMRGSLDKQFDLRQGGGKTRLLY